MKAESAKFLFYLLLPLSLGCFGQNALKDTPKIVHAEHMQAYILPNEEPIYSFETVTGKMVVLAKDKANGYIIYRFGTKDKIEFEYPEMGKSSWSKFKYSFYLRGGGTDNSGMDLNYVSFINDNFKYVIYDTYYSLSEKQNVGIKVINLKSGKMIEIKGVKKTQKGNLTDFRENKLLEIGEEAFE